MFSDDSVSKTLPGLTFFAFRFFSISEHVEIVGDTGETRASINFVCRNLYVCNVSDEGYREEVDEPRNPLLPRYESACF